MNCHYIRISKTTWIKEDSFHGFEFARSKETGDPYLVLYTGPTDSFIWLSEYYADAAATQLGVLDEWHDYCNK